MFLPMSTCTWTALGVLCCFALFVCLTLLASFFLPSHLSFKNMYVFHCMSNIILNVHVQVRDVYYHILPYMYV